MTESTDFIPIGKVGAPYGVKGWIKVHSFTAIKLNIFEYLPWYVEEKNGWHITEVTDGREHGKTLVVKFEGYDSPETVRVLTGKTLGIQRSQLPELKKDEYYWSDLQGLTVINQDGTVLGTITHMLETGANDVMVVKKDKEYAIPYLPDVVLSVDLEKREMRVNWDLI